MTRLFLRNSQYSVGARNISAAEFDGQEVQPGLGARGLSLTLASTWQDAVDRGEDPAYAGKELPYRSPRHVFARLSGERGRLRLFVELDHRSSVFTDRYNDPDRALPAATLWGAGLRFRLSGSFDISFESMNLADARVEDYLGYPLPGRTWMGGIEWRRSSETG